MLSVDGLRKSFGPLAAVRDVGFRLERGRIAALLGENGAGKTTTLRMIVGLIDREAGTVNIAGSPVGYVAEHPAFVSWLDGLDLLRATARAFGLPPRRLEAGIESLCGRLRFDPGLLGRRPATYSSGNRRKYAYLQSLLIGPRLLVVDEPYTALDPPSIAGLREVFLSLRREGAAVLLSSHMLTEVSRIADDVIVLCRGRVAGRAELGDPRGRDGRTVPDIEDIFMTLSGRPDS
jgi:ABC-2 type transport system ATP-binding protein